METRASPDFCLKVYIGYRYSGILNFVPHLLRYIYHKFHGTQPQTVEKRGLTRIASMVLETTYRSTEKEAGHNAGDREDCSRVEVVVEDIQDADVDGGHRREGNLNK